MPGHLFTEYFLTDGIRQTPERQSQRPAFNTFRDAARCLFRDFAAYHEPNEHQTEQDLIRPLLQLLGWTDDLPQQTTSGGENIPDLLLFEDAEARARAATTKASPYLEALAVAELKSFHRPLDTRGKGKGTQASSPHAQILRYLATAESETDGDFRWGILTNGAVWRLYDQKTRPRATGFYEADLETLLTKDDEERLRTFHLLFRRSAFRRRPGAAATFVETALAEGKRYEQRVAQSLAGVVFDRVFPRLIQALADASDRPMPAIRQAALIFLYRLLFVLYAEDRGLLPVNDAAYDDYGLRKRVRDDIAKRKDRNDTFSAVATSYYDHLATLFRLIDRGDPSIGLPPYNGGLFAQDAASLLNDVRLADDVIADVVYDLSHTQDEGQRRYVNYRDMSVQQLGSLYERLLEKEPVLDGDGQVEIRPNPYARKDSGSFYTPQDLVDLIVDQTLKPLVDERRAAFETRARQLRSDRRSRAARRAQLAKLDSAEAVLNLKVLDPAMGSGHFLVTAVDFLTDAIVELIEPSANVTGWLGDDDPYHSTLLDRVASIRTDILRRAQEAGWKLNETQLTDQAIIRRLVLKRCIYGVDKNPLTVELAKVSLWLHSFTVGAPLSFLDHHLRCGDSLLGLRIADANEELQRLKVPMFAASALQGVENAAHGMHQIEQLSDADVSEVHESQSLFAAVESATADIRGFLDTLGGLRWLTAGMRVRQRAAFEAPITETLGADPSRAYERLAKSPADHPHNGSSAFCDRWTEARSIADAESFLHWEVAFPGVWHRWQDDIPEGGFDAVIGNPPWGRIEQQEVEWFALRDPEVALARTAALRKSLIKQLHEAGDSLALEYAEARDRATALRTYARQSGHYPLLSGGRTNLYSLFVERALRLLNPHGLVGLLTQSGIYADKTAAEFFKSISRSGRLAALYDFENKKAFFKDVHGSQKFCVIVIGGLERKFERTKCAFFLPNTDTIADPMRSFTLTQHDFNRVNPNTGTAPIFRTRRDATITSHIYENYPVLVDRSKGVEEKAWPIRFAQGMFNMSDDSDLFRTASQLERDGFYPLEGGRWKRGSVECVPLLEGKMVQAFDHRAASVKVNPQNLHRPAQTLDTTLEQHRDPHWISRPQFWVQEKDLKWHGSPRWWLSFKDATAATNFRSMISAIVPYTGIGNTLPLLLPETPDTSNYSQCAYCLVSCFNSFVYDFVSRQKVQGQHLNWYIVEQIPVPTANDYLRRFGDRSAYDIVRENVLRLTFNSYDMIPFARDLGHYDSPFPWDEEERTHLRARLDALYFHLYGLDRDDAHYILSTFPIIQRQDEAQFDGRYRTRDLILAYMNALAAGDTETSIAL